MYWRAGTGFVALWIAALTLAMSAVAALVLARSSAAALAFLATAIVLVPPFQELLGQRRHKLAPAKAALLTTITLLPIGIGCLIVDGVAMLEAEARRLGFASAGQHARARDLGLATPQALAAHEAAIRKSALERMCRERRDRPPLDCFEPAHAKAALAFVDIHLGPGDLEAVTRDALAQQRKAWLARDKECAGLLDRIDEAALPVILASRPQVLDMAAAVWARHLARQELEQLSERARSGTSYIRKPGSEGLDAKLATHAPAVEKELDTALQAWARRIAVTEPSWRAFVQGRTPVGSCKAAQD